MSRFEEIKKQVKESTWACSTDDVWYLINTIEDLATILGRFVYVEMDASIDDRIETSQWVRFMLKTLIGWEVLDEPLDDYDEEG